MLSGENDNKIYTAEDIQRYLQGKMTPQEMHALEKASLDDEFLADAIEGYSLLTDENHSKVISALKEEITEKVTGGSKVIELKGGWKQWYRIAAVLFIMLGSAVIIYKYMFSEKLEGTQDIAREKVKTIQEPSASAVTIADSDRNVAANNPTPGLSQKVQPSKEIKTESQDQQEVAANTEPVKKKDTITISKDVAVAPSAPVSSLAKKEDAANTKAQEYKSLERKPVTVPTKEKLAGNLNTKAYTAPAQPNQVLKDYDYRYNQNIFKGRIVDNKNEPLPFARIAIKNDSFKIGTYADVKGYFSFVAPDTILEVDAMSVGYYNNTVKLQRGLLSQNKIVLHESNQSLAEVVVTGPKTNRKKALNQTIIDTSSLAEPEVGWSNYDTYITNNLV
ncbi:MAG: carboxypeptidase-like regulatory domain-containing protein, partial [Sphingobacteriales bacterium]